MDRKLVVSSCIFVKIAHLNLLIDGLSFGCIWILGSVIVIQVLGIPWDIDTEGLREYMSKFGELEDCIVMKVSL